MSELKRRDAGLWYNPDDPEIDAIHQITPPLPSVQQRQHLANTVVARRCSSQFPGHKAWRQPLSCRQAGRADTPLRERERQEKRTAILRKLVGDGLGENADIKEPFLIDFGNQLRLGERVFINHGCTILACGKIDIGDEVRFGPNVTILGVRHPLAACERGYEPGTRANQGLPVKIGRRSWIGTDVVICGGVTIGQDAFVHANSVVTRDVPAGAIVGGVPAAFMSWTPGYEDEAPRCVRNSGQRWRSDEKG